MPTVYGILVAAVILFGMTAYLIARDDKGQLEETAHLVYTCWSSPIIRGLFEVVNWVQRRTDKDLEEQDFERFEAEYDHMNDTGKLATEIYLIVLNLEQDGKLTRRTPWAKAWPMIDNLYHECEDQPFVPNLTTLLLERTSHEICNQ